jgi:uncharacterized protein YdiU (UPF0061 family)
MVPNTSDDEGRYAYIRQPEVSYQKLLLIDESISQVGHFNVRKLRDALSTLLSPAVLQDQYLDTLYWSTYQAP